MRLIVKGLVIILLLGLYDSCGILEKGYIDENKQYVPKRDRFIYKKRPQIYQAKMLDTINLYKLTEDYYDYLGEYHKNYLPIYSDEYLLFYSNGRVLRVLVNEVGSQTKVRALKFNDLNPNRRLNKKMYYHFYSNTVFTIENFIPGTGYGLYTYNDYKITNIGNKITLISNKYREIYEKVTIDSTWSKWPCNW